MARRQEKRSRIRKGKAETWNPWVGSDKEESINRSATGTQGIKAGIGDLGADIQNSFDGADLSHMDEGSTLSSANWTSAASGSDFNPSDITTDFSGKDFSEMDKPSTLSNANLTPSSSGVDFNKSELTEAAKVDLSHLEEGSTLSSVRTSVASGSDFNSGANMETDFEGRDFSGMDKGSTFGPSNMPPMSGVRVVSEGSDLSEVNFTPNSTFQPQEFFQDDDGRWKPKSETDMTGADFVNEVTPRSTTGSNFTKTNIASEFTPDGEELDRGSNFKKP